MDLLPPSAYLQDGPVAIGTARGKELMIILLTVGPPVVLEECYGRQFLLTLRTGKVLGVPCLPHGVDHLPKDGTVACSTHTL